MMTCWEGLSISQQAYDIGSCILRPVLYMIEYWHYSSSENRVQDEIMFQVFWNVLRYPLFVSDLPSTSRIAVAYNPIG